MYLSSATIFVLNYQEHVEFLNKNEMYFLPLFNELYICICISFQCILYVMGLGFSFDSNNSVGRVLSIE